LEDVKKSQLARGLLVGALLCACSFTASLGHAATQGTVGRTSIGSVSIAVSIPETVQFFINNISDPLLSANGYICLGVLDRSSAKSFNYYRIENSNDSSKLLRLKNYQQTPTNEITKCTNEERIVYAREITNFNATVLMFVPE
jgi:hypothetical protein